MRAFVVVAVIAAALGALLYFVPASALSASLGKVRAYQVGCVATAGGITLRQPGSVAGTYETMSSFFVWNNSATPVYLGGDGITSTLGMPICTDTAACPTAGFNFDAKDAVCLSSSGTVNVRVLAGTM